MKLPLVSIVMPVLNCERFLEEALISIAEQTYPSIEVIAVDGGSKDRTLDILERYSDASGDLKIICSEPGRGMGNDLNMGFAAAKGEFIARMDSDDICTPERIAQQVRYFSSYPELDLVGSGVEYFWAMSGNQYSPPWQQEIRDMYLVNNPFFHPTIMIRRRLVDRGVFLYNPDFKADEDYELWGRVIPVAMCATVQRPLLRYRMHENNSQRLPWRYRHKHLALSEFCEKEEIYDKVLVDTLTEFQCSAFISPETYGIFKEYAMKAESNPKMPKLGWIQWALVQSKSYERFINWYWGAKNWRM